MMEAITEFREEEHLSRKITSLHQALARLAEAARRLEPKDHLSVLENLEKNWFLNNYLMSPKKALFWMSSLDPEIDKELHSGTSLSVLESLFSRSDSYLREEMGTFLLLKALQPLFNTYPNYMDHEFARQMNDIHII
jgi:hypothetical protein